MFCPNLHVAPYLIRNVSEAEHRASVVLVTSSDRSFHHLSWFLCFYQDQYAGEIGSCLFDQMFSAFPDFLPALIWIPTSILLTHGQCCVQTTMCSLSSRQACEGEIDGPEDPNNLVHVDETIHLHIFASLCGWKLCLASMIHNSTSMSQWMYTLQWMHLEQTPEVCRKSTWGPGRIVGMDVS